MKEYVIITGATGGIGQAMVKVFHESGYGIIATDISPPRGELPCEYFVTADLQKTVEDEQYADKVFIQIREYLNGSPLVALINNAAVQILGSCDKLSRTDWNASLNVNLLAPFFWSQAFLTELEDAKGSIVNISSIHAELTKADFSAYAVSKAALSGLTRSMALELGDRVRINGIEPAAINTDMLRTGFRENEDGFNQLERFHPTKSIGQPEEIGKLAVILVEKGMPFMNGTVVTLNGGIGGKLYDPN